MPSGTSKKCPPGGSWAGFEGGPGVLLGGLGAFLARFLLQFDLRLIFGRFFIDFGTDQGAKREAFGEAK